MVANTCNSGYLDGRGNRIMSLRPVWVSLRPSLNKQQRTRAVAQCEALGSILIMSPTSQRRGERVRRGGGGDRQRDRERTKERSQYDRYSQY